MSPARGLMPLPRMTRAEWDVMRACWKLKRPTVRAIQLASARYSSREHYKTVQVLIGRLAKKGCLRVDRKYRANKHIPLMLHHEALLAEAEHLVAEVVGNGAAEISLVIECLERARRGRKARP